MIRLETSVTVKAAEGQTPTISGLAVPWNVEATVSDGSRVMFREGSLPEDGPAPKLLESHDLRQVRGIVTGRESTPAGMQFEAQVARTAAGNDVIELMKMGAIDSVSVGVNPTKFSFEGTTMVIEAAEWVELSLVAVPAFLRRSDFRDCRRATRRPTTRTRNRFRGGTDNEQHPRGRRGSCTGDDPHPADLG
jgi:HK97 family phage prohead protease